MNHMIDEDYGDSPMSPLYNGKEEHDEIPYCSCCGSSLLFNKFSMLEVNSSETVKYCKFCIQSGRFEAHFINEIKDEDLTIEEYNDCIKEIKRQIK